MRTPSTALRLEALESRIAPASIVNVTFTAGALSLVGDADAHDFSIKSIDASTIELKAAAGTLFHPTTGADTDTLRLSSAVKSLSVTLGDAADHVSLAGLSIAGDVTIAGGAGVNTIDLDTLTIKGGMKITGGGAADEVEVTGGTVSVKKDLVLELGDGANVFTTNAALLQVGGKLSYTGGSGTETFTTEGSIAVKKDLSFTLGAGFATLSGIQALGFSVGGSLIVDSTGSLAGDKVEVEILSYAGQVKGNLQITDGAGDLQFTQPVVTGSGIGGKIDVVTGPGESNVALGGLYYFYGLGGVSKTKSIMVDASASSKSYFGFGFSKGGSGGFKYLGGVGADNVQVYSFSKSGISALVDVDLGDGDNEFAAVGYGASFKNVKVKGGSGEDQMQIGILDGKAANIDIQTGAGDSAVLVYLLNASVTGKITVSNAAGAGTAELVLGAINGTINSLDFDSVAATNQISLDGSGIFGSTVTNGLKVKKSFHLITGAGADTVDFTGAQNLTAGSFDLELGDGINTVTGVVTNFVAKNLNVTGGAGADTVTLSGTGSLGKTMLTLGAGVNTATFGGGVLPLALSSLAFTSTSFVGEADSLTLARVLVTGKFDAKFGADASTLQIDDSVIGGPFNAETGAGADMVKLDTATTNTGTILVKAAALKLGDGADSLTLGGNGTSSLLTTKSTFTADGEAGMNTLTNPVTNVFAKEPVFVNLVNV